MNFFKKCISLKESFPIHLFRKIVYNVKSIFELSLSSCYQVTCVVEPEMFFADVNVRGLLTWTIYTCEMKNGGFFWTNSESEKSEGTFRWAVHNSKIFKKKGSHGRRIESLDQVKVAAIKNKNSLTSVRSVITFPWSLRKWTWWQADFH